VRHRQRGTVAPAGASLHVFLVRACVCVCGRGSALSPRKCEGSVSDRLAVLHRGAGLAAAALGRCAV